MSGLLWDLVQHRCDLMGQFEAVKNYFLLGRGDFYQQFLDEVGVLGICATRVVRPRILRESVCVCCVIAVCPGMGVVDGVT